MTPEEIIATQLRGYPDRPTTPGMPVINERPNIGKLYEMLATLQGKPVDYSGLEKVAQGRKASAERDFAGGLAMSLMGGKELAPLGEALFKQSLAMGTPLRANLADVGYEDPESGAFVENPATARARDEKVIGTRIDALVKEQDAQARIALAQGNQTAADTARQNSGVLKLLALAIAQQNANTRAAKDTGPAAPKHEKGLIGPDGQVIYTDPGTGRYVDREGNAVLEPMTITDYNKKMEGVRTGDSAYALGKTLVSGVEQNPGAFGPAAAATSTMLPSAMQGWVNRKTLTDAEQQVRANVMKNAYTVIHSLAGAALSMHEQKRLDPFIPQPSDPPEVVVNKLKGAIREYEIIKTERQKKPRLPSAAPVQPSVSDDELIQKYLRGAQ